MRRFLLIAAAALIALVGLSANQCGGAKDDTGATTTDETKPADSMSDDSMSEDSDSMSGNDDTVNEIPADE